MKDFLVRFLIIVPLIFGACAPESRHEQGGSAPPLSVETTYEPPRPTIVKEDGYKIARGATKLKDIQAKFDEETGSMRLSGAVEYLPTQGGAYKTVKVDLIGMLKDGFIVMKPEPGAEIDENVRVAAKATCLSEEGTCTSSFIDIYLYTDGVVYHHQIETKEPKKEVQPEAKPESKKDSGKSSEKSQKPVKPPKTPEEAIDNAPVRPAPQDTAEEAEKEEEGERLRRPEKDDVIVDHDDEENDDEDPHEHDGDAADESEEGGLYVGMIGDDIEKILKIKRELDPAQSKEERDARAQKEKEEPEIENVPVPTPRPEYPEKKDDAKKPETKKEEPKKEETKKEEPKKQEPKKEEPKKEEQETLEKPKVSPTPQSIGKTNSGRLVNAVNMWTWEKKHAPSGFHIIRSYRGTHFATNEMAYVLNLIGKMTLNLVPKYVVPVGDISLEKGGVILKDSGPEKGQPRHKSHMSGRDADVGYYYEDKKLMTNLFSAVDNRKVWMADEQWQLFKSIVRTQYIDMIIVHPTLKNELCKQAIKKGEVDKNTKSGVAFETLRRLFPDRGHDTHFHLRVKCSKGQYACKQGKEPAAKTGCF